MLIRDRALVVEHDDARQHRGAEERDMIERRMARP